MRRVMIRYKVRPEHAAANEELVRAVYEELGRGGSPGTRYATFVLPDGVSFVHLHEGEDGGNGLTSLAAFRRFQEGIAERCAEPPVVTELREVGSFQMFAA
jgi:hypothetical protein